MKDLRLLIMEHTGCSDATSDFREAVHFLAKNQMFGIPWEEGYGSLLIPEDNAIELHNRLDTYLEHYGLPDEDKFSFLKQFLEDRFPITMRRMDELIAHAHGPMADPPYQLYDFLASALEKELHLMDNHELKDLADQMDGTATKEATECFAFFAEWMKKKYPVAYSIAIKVNKRTEKTTTQAYDLPTICLLYYCFFSLESISENEMFRKACDSAKYADTFAYFCIHLISSLRDKDIMRLQLPNVNDPGKTLAAIKDGTFSDGEAIRALRSAMDHLNRLMPVPSKTSSAEDVDSLYLYIPPDLEAHFGKLLLICGAHRLLSGQSFLSEKANDYWDLLDIMGPTIAAPFLERDFCPTAFSKSIMQGLELMASQSGEGGALERAMLGYKLASRARSHKGGFAAFSETTAIYLKDNAFTGLSPSMIACELFERGILSNIPSMLLSLLSHGEFEDFNFIQQTKLIQKLGLNAMEVEKMMTCFLEAKEKSQSTIQEILTLTEGDRVSAIRKLLHTLAIGMAPGKTDGAMCFMMAIDRPCPFPCLRQCLACKYRIDTRGTLFQVGGEFKRLVRLKRESDTKGDELKYRLIISQFVLPAINDGILAAQKELGDDTAEIFETVIGEACGFLGEGGSTSEKE